MHQRAPYDSQSALFLRVRYVTRSLALLLLQTSQAALHAARELQNVCTLTCLVDRGRHARDLKRETLSKRRLSPSDYREAVKSRSQQHEPVKGPTVR